MSRSTKPFPPTLPVRWWNLPLWAAKTVNNSLYHRKKPPRPFTLRRFRRSLFPSLDQPIFILGAGRSGTTFLGDCLDALPEISYHHEPVATKAAVKHIYAGEWTQAQAARYYRTVYRWLMRIYLDGDLRFAEKTPRNGYIVEFLASAFPDSKFIHIVRDGRATALSLSKKPWLSAAAINSERHEPGGYPHGPYPRYWVPADRRQEFFTTSDIHRCIWDWRSNTEAVLASLQRLPPSRYHQLRYEAIAEDPHGEADRITSFLGITSEESRRSFREAVARFKPDSLDRWKEELGPQDLEIIEREAGPLLRKLGYTSSAIVEREA